MLIFNKGLFKIGIGVPNSFGSISLTSFGWEMKEQEQ